MTLKGKLIQDLNEIAPTMMPDETKSILYDKKA